MNKTIYRGVELPEAENVAILIHGRGSSAEQILSLADHLRLDKFSLLAPQATNNTWYPYSFMAPKPHNQPYLDRSLQQIDELVKSCLEQGKTSNDIYIIGFSQGACLALEYATRNATRYGGIIAFTGGLIGEKLDKEIYNGDFRQTPVFMGVSQQDIHVPLERFLESEKQISSMGAIVKKSLFSDTYHTVREEEIDWVNQHMFS